MVPILLPEELFKDCKGYRICRWTIQSLDCWDTSETYIREVFYFYSYKILPTPLRSGCAKILRIRIGMIRLSVGDSDGSAEIR